MATKATTLFSRQKVKDYVLGASAGATHDTLIDQIADGVSERIETYTGRKFVNRSVTETRDGNGKQFIFLRNYPVVSVEALKIRYSLLDAWTTLTVATETVLDTFQGRLYLNSLYFPRGPLSVEVQYTTGFGGQDAASLPQDIWQAGLDYAKFVYQRNTSGATMATSVTIGPNTMAIVPDIPADIKRVLDNWMKKRAVLTI